MLKLFAALVLMAMLFAACNHYVCPAYTKDAAKEQTDTERS
jgi:PBP1b-binding outer membrane lipoprotein LpoB